MNRKRILVIIIIVLIILGIGSFFLFSDFFNKKTVENPNDQANNEASKETKNEPRTITLKPIDPVEQTKTEVKRSREFSKDDLMRIAGAFAERYGSYSNQSNFTNVTDLKLFMSQKMQKWAELYVEEQQAKRLDTSIYYGITTKSVAQEIKDYDDDVGKANLLIKTRRREATGTTNNTSKVFDQDILITFVKEEGSWKVDSATWQNK